MSKIFVDTDICLDLLSGRKPHNKFAERLFSMADRGNFKIAVSSLSFSHLDYMLKSIYKRNDSRIILSRFKTMVTVLAVNDKVIDLAMASDFNDFEDAIQYHTAIENNHSVIITRNLRDYRKAQIRIMTPEMFFSEI